MEMGKEIRRLRNDRGLTQEALAAALNVTAQTVSKWECGNSIPDVQLLPEIAVYFGVTIDQLFAMTPSRTASIPADCSARPSSGSWSSSFSRSRRILRTRARRS